ncbi:hypothetical protein [Thalassotalea loyana]|nr:hypothetical protein [Thalassotalea loyana]
MVQFNKNRIEINGNTVEVPYSILEAREFGQNILVIFDYMEFNQNSVVRNFHCIYQDGSALWVAENPTSKSTDAFTNFANLDFNRNKVIVNNFAGFTCTIDLADGKLSKREFTKLRLRSALSEGTDTSLLGSSSLHILASYYQPLLRALVLIRSSIAIFLPFFKN